MRVFHFLLGSIVFLFAIGLLSQPATNNTSPAKAQDLPSWLGDFKKLDEKELAEKKEGWYATGLPLFGNDPVAGRGLGVIANVFYNGDKSTPSFAYSPYEHQINLGIYRTNRDTQMYYLTWDAPYFEDTPFRLRSYLGYDSNLHNQYFGATSNSLNPLTYQERNSVDGRIVRNALYSEFEEANSYIANRGVGREAVSTQRRHEYKFETTYAQFFLDKTIYQVIRIWGGTEFSNNIVKRYDGQWTTAKEPITGISLPVQENTTLVTEDARANRIKGVEGGYLNYLRGGIAYDTRDYEPDPDRGWLIEYNVNRAEKAIGSSQSYTRHLVQAKNFWQPFPKLFEELVIAQRAALTKVDGDIPFYDYRYLYSIDGPFGALGGQNTLRGYRQERFFGPVIGFYNFEMRWRLGNVHLWDQFFQLSIVPFYDVGRVWDKLNQVSTMGYKHSRGIGLRIVWDQATVILMDWAVSKEDKLFYLDIGHTF